MEQKKKGKVQFDCINVFINTSFNNTLVYLTDISGNVLVWSSAGCHGFKGLLIDIDETNGTNETYESERLFVDD